MKNKQYLTELGKGFLTIIFFLATMIFFLTWAAIQQYVAYNLMKWKDSNNDNKRKIENGIRSHDYRRIAELWQDGMLKYTENETGLHE